MSNPESQSSRFGTICAIVIALVTVTGAIISWRVAVAMGDASSADTQGLLATVEREDVLTRATTTLLGHLAAYTAFVRDDALASAFDDFANANPQRTDFLTLSRAARLAANVSRDNIPPLYIDRDNKLDHQRDLGENIAQFSLNQDIEPQPHFVAADASRRKALGLLGTVLLLGVALILLTMADAIQNMFRYLFFLGGLGIFLFGTLAAVLVELIGVPAIGM